jgi:hypothetical protein
VDPALTAADTFHDLNLDTTGFHLGVHAGQTDRAGLVLPEPGTYLADCSVPGHREARMEIEVTDGQAGVAPRGTPTGPIATDGPGPQSNPEVEASSCSRSGSWEGSRS